MNYDFLGIKMDTERYRVIFDNDLQFVGIINDSGGFRYHVVEFPPGDQPHIIGSDGGEPEDQLLVRDWDWVVVALNDAYKKGFKDGQQR